MTEKLLISGLTFEVRRSSRRRTLGLTIDRSGDLVVHAPVDTAESELKKWVSGKLLWVHQKLAQKRDMAGEVYPPEFVSGESIYYLGRSYRLRIVNQSDTPLRLDDDWFVLSRDAQLEAATHFRHWFIDQGGEWLRSRSKELERVTGRSPKDISVRDLGFRWGSCGRNGTLYFNWRVLQLPSRIIDYVIIHEQVHLIHHNHSRAFWNALEQAMPDWSERRDELNGQWARFSRFAVAEAMTAARAAGEGSR